MNILTKIHLCVFVATNQNPQASYIDTKLLSFGPISVSFSKDDNRQQTYFCDYSTADTGNSMTREAAGFCDSQRYIGRISSIRTETAATQLRLP